MGKRKGLFLPDLTGEGNQLRGCAESAMNMVD